MVDPIRIILADDHPVLRQGTSELLRREADIEIVGEAENGLQAIELAEQHRPDLVIMDIRMPEVSGVESTRQIRERVPGVQVIVLTAHDDDQYVISALEAGASGYLLKTAPISELTRAIRQVHAGQPHLDASIIHKVVKRISGSMTGMGEYGDNFSTIEPLTARELEVLQLLAQGNSNRAIAEQLCISGRTVQAHLTHIYSKMQVTSRTEAIMFALKHGWISIEA